jgi:hypothetical protein
MFVQDRYPCCASSVLSACFFESCELYYSYKKCVFIAVYKQRQFSSKQIEKRIEIIEIYT